MLPCISCLAGRSGTGKEAEDTQESDNDTENDSQKTKKE